MRLGPQGLPGAANVTLDTPLFLLAFAVTTIVGLLVGLIPAIGNGDLKGAIPQGAWQAASSHRLTRRSLVVAEIAFALVLLVGAGLLFQSLRQLFAITPGFDPAQRADHAGAGRGPCVTGSGPPSTDFSSRRSTPCSQVPGVERAALTGAAAAQRRFRRLRRAVRSGRRGLGRERRRVPVRRQSRVLRDDGHSAAARPGDHGTGSRVGAAGGGDQRIARAPAVSRRRSDRPAPAHRPHRRAVVHGGRRGGRRQAAVARDPTGSTPSTWRRSNGILRIARCRS